MKSIERFLLALDSGPGSALSRVVLGLALVPVFRVIACGNTQAWVSLMLFVGLLAALRVGPAVLRKLLPFSQETKDVWLQRRQIAKLYDSYQWQKLFWIGLGVSAYGVAGGGLRTGELMVALICLVGGGVGLLLWRRYSVAPATAAANG